MVYPIYKVFWSKRLVNLRFASQYLYLLELKFNLDNFNKLELKKNKVKKQNKTKQKQMYFDEHSNLSDVKRKIVHQMLKGKRWTLNIIQLIKYLTRMII